MDWLEDFFPFLRELDAGNGALEVALVLLVAVIIAAIGLVAIRRSRARAAARGEVVEPHEPLGPAR